MTMDFSPQALARPDLPARGALCDALDRVFDAGLVASRSQQPRREYLGGSRLGHPLAREKWKRGCTRALVFEYQGHPKDEGRDFKASTYRIFDMGHDGEDRVAEYVRLAGFELLTHGKDGEQFGYSQLDGKIKGHIDGVIVGGPAELPNRVGDAEVIKFSYPMLWETKALKGSKWTEARSKGIEVSHPLYFGQVQLYMAYMGLHANPCFFTILNRDTGELTFELVAYNVKAAQASSDRGVEVISAESPFQIPRVSADRTHLPCKWCDYQDSCWEGPDAVRTEDPHTTERPTWLS